MVSQVNVLSVNIEITSTASSYITFIFSFSNLNKLIVASNKKIHTACIMMVIAIAVAPGPGLRVTISSATPREEACCQSTTPHQVTQPPTVKTGTDQTGVQSVQMPTTPPPLPPSGGASLPPAREEKDQAGIDSRRRESSGLLRPKAAAATEAAVAVAELPPPPPPSPPPPPPPPPLVLTMGGVCALAVGVVVVVVAAAAGAVGNCDRQDELTSLLTTSASAPATS
jgi:hypothetical protein